LSKPFSGFYESLVFGVSKNCSTKAMFT
jgi:hypothetical protein